MISHWLYRKVKIRLRHNHCPTKSRQTPPPIAVRSQRRQFTIQNSSSLRIARMSSQPQSDEFKEAVKKSDNIKTRPGNDDLLQVRSRDGYRGRIVEGRTRLTVRRAQLYALFKQGTQDPPIEESPAPGLWDPKVGSSQSIVGCGIVTNRRGLAGSSQETSVAEGRRRGGYTGRGAETIC